LELGEEKKWGGRRREKGEGEEAGEAEVGGRSRREEDWGKA
jgi:hypothetical protein